MSDMSRSLPTSVVSLKSILSSKSVSVCPFIVEQTDKNMMIISDLIFKLQFFNPYVTNHEAFAVTAEAYFPGFIEQARVIALVDSP